MYKVFKDHAELADYKTLVAAKKLAEKQHGEVFCDGKKVYPAEQDGSADMSTTDTKDATAEVQAEDIVEADAPDTTGRYRIESLMNVRLHPALNADIVGIAQPGTVVTVTSIHDDWMAIKNGNETVYVLYGGGRYASRIFP